METGAERLVVWIAWEHKHRNFEEFVKFIHEQSKYFDLRNTLGSYAGKIGGDDCSKFYGDLVKLLYDHFMTNKNQERLRRRWRNKRTLKIEGVELDE